MIRKWCFLQEKVACRTWLPLGSAAQDDVIVATAPLDVIIPTSPPVLIPPPDFPMGMPKQKVSPLLTRVHAMVHGAEKGEKDK